MDELIIGIDIGGTSVKIGFINHDAEIIYNWEIPTIKDNQGNTILEDIWSSITDKLEKQKRKNKIIGIGVGAPGFVNAETGFVYEAVNIGWRNFNLKAELQRLSNLPVFIENDANLAVLAENWKGSGNHAKDVLLITLGTGVGSGIIANGDILSGTNGTAGEIGHIIGDPNGYLCNCGRVGCLDTIASANGIVNQALAKVAEHPESSLASHYKKYGKLETKDIFNLAAAGDTISESVIDRTTDILGFMLASAAAIINPSRIIIGGGVSKAGKPLLSNIDKYFKKYSLPRISDCCEIKIAKLGNDAGIIGAAYLVKKNLNYDLFSMV